MREPQALVSTEQLAAALGQPTVRVYDCTTYLETPPPGSDDPYLAVSGRGTFEEAHVPGADFLDLQGEFSDSTTRLRFMMPAPAQLEAEGNGARALLVKVAGFEQTVLIPMGSKLHVPPPGFVKGVLRYRASRQPRARFSYDQNGGR
jgi:hypothetical protein